MKIFKTVEGMKNFSRECHCAGKIIGLVPTMGALHEGHLSLVKASKEKCDVTIVSVFVNPTQFAPNEDFAAYPRTFEKDVAELESLGVDAVFYPSPEEMYPAGFSTYVNVEGGLTKKLCGASRPIHFRGVATVVTKLMNITQADESFFGQKDAQQVAIVKRFVADLNLSPKVNMLPIVREKSGLALSSRNAYLSAEEKISALALSRGLKKAEAAFFAGEKNSATLKKIVRDELATEPSISADYVELLKYPSLEETEFVAEESLLAAAIFIGKTRLIDNVILTPNS